MSATFVDKLRLLKQLTAMLDKDYGFNATEHFSDTIKKLDANVGNADLVDSLRGPKRETLAEDSKKIYKGVRETLITVQNEIFEKINENLTSDQKNALTTALTAYNAELRGEVTQEEATRAYEGFEKTLKTLLDEAKLTNTTFSAAQETKQAQTEKACRIM